MQGEFLGIFGQDRLFSSRTTLPYPQDVKALMDQEELFKKQDTYLGAALSQIKPISTIKKDILPKIAVSLDSYDLSPSINTWYAKSIYAKEILLRKASKRRLAPNKDKNSGRYYHNLDSFELEPVKIPKMKLDFTGL
jgi:hypothetical protein